MPASASFCAAREVGAKPSTCSLRPPLLPGPPPTSLFFHHPRSRQADDLLALTKMSSTTSRCAGTQLRMAVSVAMRSEGETSIGSL